MTTKTMSPWKRFVGLLQLDKRDIKQIFYYAVFAGLVALSLPLGIQAIINLLQGAQITSSWIVLVILVTLGVAFQGGLQIMQIRIIENIQQKIFMRSSFEFVYRFPKIKYSELTNYYPPELANRFFDTLTVQKGLPKMLIDFPAAVLQILFGIILLSFYHSFFIIYGILVILLIYVVFKFTAKKGLETSLKESKSKYKVAHWIQEIARSLISFKLSGNTSLAMNRNDELTTEYLNARENHFKILLMQFVQMIGFKVLVTAGLLIIGGLLVLNQKMNIGQFVAAEIIILLVISSVEKLISVLETFYDVLTSLEKIGQVVDKEIEPQEGVDPFETKGEFKIELDKVNYKTSDGKIILNDVNLLISEKDRILLKGASGSGKTTLLKLIAGIDIPTRGSVYINDFSIKGIWPNAYRSQVGQVLPEQQTFEGTILENITFNNPNISRKHLNEVLQNLGLLPFIKQQSNGLQTILIPKSHQLSYTISKRIVLARAIVHNPKLLILKDPLEYFDLNEAEEIIDYLTDKKQNWSIVIVSSNPLWKAKCSKTIKLTQGILNIENHA